MFKNPICLLLFLANIPISSMEEGHHKKTKSRSGSNEFVTINILPTKEDKKDEEINKKEDRRNQLKIAAIAATSAIIGAGLTAAVTLTIHFTECNTNNP